MAFNKNKFPPWTKYLLIPLGIWLAYKVYQVIKSSKAAAVGVVTAIQNNAASQLISQAISNAGLTPIRTSACIDIAEAIYNAFYKDSWWGMGEDEVAAMDAFKSCLSTQEAQAVAAIYKANFKKSLSDDILKFCHNTDFDGVKTSHLNAIKGI